MIDKEDFRSTYVVGCRLQPLQSGFKCGSCVPPQMSTNVSVVAMKLVAALTPTASTHWETIDANAKTASLVMGTTAEVRRIYLHLVGIGEMLRPSNSTMSKPNNGSNPTNI